jgi:RNA polymerase sigma factor (sigma-70 family)
MVDVAAPLPRSIVLALRQGWGYTWGTTMSGPDTSMGGSLREFPPTPGFIKRLPGQDAPSWGHAVEHLSRMYWKPVYLYLRTVGRMSNDDSKDLTQQFFLHLLENQTVARYQPTRAPFRVYLKTCLKNFLTDHLRQRASLKRSGDQKAVPLEGAAEAAASGPEGEDPFERAWLQTLLEEALEEARLDLLARGRGVDWTIFEAYELRGAEAVKTTYADLGRAHGRSEADVRGALAYVRGRLRDHVVAQVRRSVTDPEELRLELAHLGLL